MPPAEPPLAYIGSPSRTRLFNRPRIRQGRNKHAIVPTYGVAVKHRRLLTFALVTPVLVLAAVGYQFFSAQAVNNETLTRVLLAAGNTKAFLASSDAQRDHEGYRISALAVFSNVALHVKDNYVDPSRIKPKEMLLSALREVERQVAEVLVEDMKDGNISIRVVDKEKVIYIDDVHSLWEINLKLREIFRFLERHIPPQDDIRSVEYAAVNGALSVLDPHSILLKPEAFAEMKTHTKGEFGGLGIVISVRESKLTIISPLEDTPAWRAGLKAGDIISRIGDVSTVSMPIEEAVRMLRGPEGSKVTIWVDRKSWNSSKKFVITRERIKIQSVESRLLAGKVGYIKIKNFQQNTGKDLEVRLNKLQKKAGGKLKGLVLDLRNNPGGLLKQAIRVSDKFVSSGDIVTTVGYGNKLREPERARWSGTESKLPLAVLVNRGSASASEIVAGALKNLDRAVVIGERTFGKGSVQVLYDFSDNSALKLTIAQYLTPGGISIQSEGVTPDIELKPSWIEKDSVRLFYEPEGHREKSLEKHLERAAGHQGESTKPHHRLTYLLDRKDETKEKEKPKDLDAFEEDDPIKMARRLLSRAGSPSRAEMLKRGQSYIQDQAKEFTHKVEKRIGSLGVDWSSGKETKDARSKVQAKLEIVGANAGEVQAGDEIKLKASVTNRNGSDLYRVHGTIESDHGAFEGREFLFGRIKAGETKSWTITTKIPKEASSRADVIKLELASASGPLAVEPSVPVITKHVPHPQLAYTYVLDDSERGDGDGILELGEGVELVLFVSNTGLGDADEVTIRLKSKAQENLFLERGRVNLGALKKGDTRTERLRFRVPKEASTKVDLPLELTIYDAGTGEWLEDQLILRARAKKATKVAKRSGGVAAKDDLLVHAAASPGSTVIASAKSGAKFPAKAKSSGFVQVKLLDGGTGWVKEKHVRGIKKVKKPATDRLSFLPLRRPPTIALSNSPGGKVVEAENVTLAGTVTGRALRDMYVVLNDKKIFFASGPQLPSVNAPATIAPEWTRPNEEAAQLPFSLNLTLKEGLNKVLVVARLDEKIIAYKSIYVSRKIPATEVAKVAEPPKDHAAQ